MGLVSVRIGVDIGGTWTDAAAVEVTGATFRVLTQRAVRTARGAAGVLSGLHSAYHRVVQELGARPVDGVGIGVPGIVTDGQVTHAVNLGLDGRPLDLGGEAARMSAAPVIVENDVKAAAWGAARWLQATSGGARGRDLALVNVGTGLAAGLVLDGALRRGSRGLAGEIGHLVTDRSGPPCPCGKRGCLELYASGGGMARRWSGSARDLMAAAELGDPLAVAVRDDLVAGLAQAVRILVQATDVAEVVLAGGVVTSTPALQEAVGAALRDHADSGFEAMLCVHERLRWLPEDYPAGSVGAALLGQATSAPGPLVESDTA